MDQHLGKQKGKTKSEQLNERSKQAGRSKQADYKQEYSEQ